MSWIHKVSPVNKNAFFAKINIYDIKYKHNKSLTSEQDTKPEGEVGRSSVKGLSRGRVQQDQENTDKEVKYNTFFFLLSHFLFFLQNDSTEDKVRGQSHRISRYNPIHLVGNIFHLKGIQSHTFFFQWQIISDLTFKLDIVPSPKTRAALSFDFQSCPQWCSAETPPDHVQG